MTRDAAELFDRSSGHCLPHRPTGAAEPCDFGGTRVGMRVALTSRMRIWICLLLAACTDAPSTTPADGYRTLIDGDWTLAAGSEKYVCVRKTMTEDAWIQNLRPVAPTGTHHTVLMVGSPTQADGITDCNSSLASPAIYASGVGTEPLELPEGVAVHVRAGQQLLLNLHLFNSSDAEIAGTSGVEVLEVDPAAVQHEAGVVLAGKMQGLQAVPGASTQIGTCTTPAGMTVYALAPHMHVLGTHMKVTYEGRVLHDAPYTFDGQRYEMLTPEMTTVANGKMTVECSYFNPTGTTVEFGESTEQEMCFALTFVSPPPPSDTCIR